MKEFTFPHDRKFLMQRMGDISQLAGIKRYVMSDGKAQGIDAADIRTGSGFSFTVLPGRGMDIAWADYRGTPIGYMAKTGMASPAYYETEGIEWLRTFFAGLLTTCGLCNAGGPCTDQDPLLGAQKFGLHGRISNMGADNVSVKEEWQGGKLVMTLSGRLRESYLHGPNLTLRREITARLGESRLCIHDVVENEGFTEQPLMLLYHINLGYPVLDDGSRLLCSSKEIHPSSDIAKRDLKIFNRMGKPAAGTPERVYFHKPNAKASGEVTAALVNDRLELGAYIRFNRKQLPWLTEWKQLSAAEYVVGVEPGNCLPIGRIEQRKRGDLQIIKPGEKRVFDVEIGVLPDKQAIAEVERRIRAQGGTR